jgi:endoglucanase
MMKFNLDLDMLSALCDVPGLPGREASVSAVIKHYLPSDVETSTDALENLVAHIPGKGPKLLFMAHMDEVGLLVRGITNQGYLNVERLGGISIRNLPGSRMQLWTDNGHILSQVGTLPQHLDNSLPLELKDVYIDIGAETRQQAKNMGVQIGDALTWYSPLQKMGETLISAKALDDRLGCFILITLAQYLCAEELENDIYLAFVVQEETMLSGVTTVVNQIKPDFVIGVDGTLTFDTPDLAKEQNEIFLGKGPALKWMDAIRGKLAFFVPDFQLTKNIRKLANSHEIPLQDELVVGISTALMPIPFCNTGVRAAALSFPLRYHHTPVEMADLRDIENLISLLRLIVLQNLNG